MWLFKRKAIFQILFSREMNISCRGKGSAAVVYKPTYSFQQLKQACKNWHRACITTSIHLFYQKMHCYMFVHGITEKGILMSREAFWGLRIHEFFSYGSGSIQTWPNLSPQRQPELCSGYLWKTFWSPPVAIGRWAWPSESLLEATKVIIYGALKRAWNTGFYCLWFSRQNRSENRFSADSKGLPIICHMELF